jgi:hypothetical protein
MQRIAHRTVQPAAVHPVIGLRVADQRLDGLAAPEQAPLVRAQRLVLATVDDLHPRVVGVHAPVGSLRRQGQTQVTGVRHKIAQVVDLLGFQFHFWHYTAVSKRCRVGASSPRVSKISRWMGSSSPYGRSRGFDAANKAVASQTGAEGRTQRHNAQFVRKAATVNRDSSLQ